MADASFDQNRARGLIMTFGAARRLLEPKTAIVWTYEPDSRERHLIWIGTDFVRAQQVVRDLVQAIAAGLRGEPDRQDEIMSDGRPGPRVDLTEGEKTLADVFSERSIADCLDAVENLGKNVVEHTYRDPVGGPDGFVSSIYLGAPSSTVGGPSPDLAAAIVASAIDNDVPVQFARDDRVATTCGWGRLPDGADGYEVVTWPEQKVEKFPDAESAAERFVEAIGPARAYRAAMAALYDKWPVSFD